MSTTRSSHAPAVPAAPETDPARPTPDSAPTSERGPAPADYCATDSATRRNPNRSASQRDPNKPVLATTESGAASTTGKDGIAHANADMVAAAAELADAHAVAAEPTEAKAAGTVDGGAGEFGSVAHKFAGSTDCGPAAGHETPAVRLRGARLSYGERTLWAGLDLEVAAGEFIAVLGPNGSGKTSLLRMLLGQLAPSAGSVEVAGAPARVGNPHIGYVPQQKTIDSGVPLRGLDLVGLGVDGHRWGLGWRGRKERQRRVADAVAQVGARHYAHAPLESMSGGEQQRLRVAQALVGDPRVLLCDEPLLSLDMANQRLVAELIDARRRGHGTAVMFVTHEINPVLPLVDRVLYLVDGKFRIGTPDEVMTSEVLSELYRTEVDVLRVRGRLVVVGTGDATEGIS